MFEIITRLNNNLNKFVCTHLLLCTEINYHSHLKKLLKCYLVIKELYKSVNIVVRIH